MNRTNQGYHIKGSLSFMDSIPQKDNHVWYI